MTKTHSSISQVFNSTDLRRKIFHLKSLPKKKQVHRNHSLVMQEFKCNIKSYIDFFKEWNKVPSWIHVPDEEPWHDFVDIVNNIYRVCANCQYHCDDTPYGWLFQGMRRPYGQGLPIASTNTSSW